MINLIFKMTVYALLHAYVLSQLVTNSQASNLDNPYDSQGFISINLTFTEADISRTQLSR